jgi:hypothetical protein
MGIDPEVPRGVAGDHPAFDIPEHPAGDAPEDGADSSRRIKAAGVGEVHFADLPIDDVAAAGAKAAEGHMGGAFIGGLHVAGCPIRRWAVGEGDIDLGGAIKKRTGFHIDGSRLRI